jgi:DNA polymerase I-like protein with 3'-5' exonuclease and polymerase domains
LIFEIKKNKVEKYMPRLEELMSGAAKLKVPLLVEGVFGKNWGELK